VAAANRWEITLENTLENISLYFSFVLLLTRLLDVPLQYNGAFTQLKWRDGMNNGK
jgi:hypothetical protein